MDHPRHRQPDTPVTRDAPDPSRDPSPSGGRAPSGAPSPSGAPAAPGQDDPPAPPTPPARVLPVSRRAPSAGPCTSRSARLQPSGSHPAVTLALPLDFAAFCELHQPHYTHYARLRLDPAAAEQAVQATFGDLAIRWPRVLRCPSPAAWAWHTFKSRIAQALQPPGGVPRQAAAGPPGVPEPRSAADDICPALPDAVADTLTLHHALHLTPTQIADVTGTDPATVAYHLHTAERRLRGRPR